MSAGTQQRRRAELSPVIPALFGSRPSPNDGIWQYAQRAGFELHIEGRNYANKEKKIDTGIASLLTKDAYKRDGYRNGKPDQRHDALCQSYDLSLNDLLMRSFRCSRALHP